ncbi:MAG: septum formation initiator family protein [Chitinophagaceae bacterium]|nr:septum formation initiator family protein [Chitinophagaceae bacterium]
MKQFTKWISNKYLLSSVFFIIWISFFDRFNVFQIIKRKQELTQLTERKQHYKKEIEKSKTELLNLRENSINIEKIAREKYLMKKDNEDLYTIEK